MKPKTTRCRSCVNEYNRTWKKTPKGRLLQQRSKKAYRQRHPNKIKDYYHNWYLKNGRNRAVDYQEAIKEWKENNPEKIDAHNKLNYALKIGKVIKPKKCSECKLVKRLSAHHKDYSKPLVVLWLCSSCHKLKHKVNP